MPIPLGAIATSLAGFTGGEMLTRFLMSKIGKGVGGGIGSALANPVGLTQGIVGNVGGFAGDLALQAALSGDPFGSAYAERSSNEAQLNENRVNNPQQSQGNQLALIDLLQQQAEAGNLQPLLEQAGGVI